MDVAEDTGKLVPLQDCREEWLIYKLDQEISHSDWTIETVQMDTPRVVAAYHVHKTYLSLGPKKSIYFERLFNFQGARFDKESEEARVKTSRLELHQLALDAFPVYLDYIYSGDDVLAITHENAAGLCWLAQYLQVARLGKKVAAFWESDFPIEQWGTYYAHSKIFHNDKLCQLVVHASCKALSDFSFDSILNSHFDAKIWLEILECCKQKSGYVHYVLSGHLADFCFKNKDKLNGATFTMLTDARVLRRILPWQAPMWMEVEKALMPKKFVTSSLRRRCTQSLGPPSEMTRTSWRKYAEGWYKCREEEFFPPLVIVSGAEPGVNGIYRGYRDKRYYLGEGGSFAIHTRRLVPDPDAPAHWYWSITRLENNLLTNDDLYRTRWPMQWGLCGFSWRPPPRHGWEKIQGNKSPVLTILYDVPHDITAPV